ncbi:amidoligase family protein [Dinoroseobacter sp. S124A]|uniref:amidoligase family protein n=1 Tax=Dinoroseobacter sp. S124A TaxID=3415128 RepID=UPI003C7BC2F5
MTHFIPLPFPDLASGRPRRCGVEIEFAGLTEAQVVALILNELGGELGQHSRHAATVTGTELGDIRVELDFSLAHDHPSELLETGIGLARPLIPVEVITEPLDPAQLPILDALCAALRREGGEGTGQSMLRGFGVHLNVEAHDPDEAFTRRTILAFALLEPWLRATLPPDNTRRVLPFVNPWPVGLVDALVADPDAPFSIQCAHYAAHVKTRNHGLDLLPLFKFHAPQAYARAFPDAFKVAARPAFHFRLPDCRLNDADWSLSEAWSMWRAVETLAAAPDLLTTLCSAWTQHRKQLFGGSRKWARTVSDLTIPQSREAS